MDDQQTAQPEPNQEENFKPQPPVNGGVNPVDQTPGQGGQQRYQPPTANPQPQDSIGFSPGPDQHQTAPAQEGAVSPNAPSSNPDAGQNQSGAEAGLELQYNPEDGTFSYRSQPETNQLQPAVTPNPASAAPSQPQAPVTPDTTNQPAATGNEVDNHELAAMQTIRSNQQDQPIGPPQINTFKRRGTTRSVEDSNAQAEDPGQSRPQTSSHEPTLAPNQSNLATENLTGEPTSQEALQQPGPSTPIQSADLSAGFEQTGNAQPQAGIEANNINTTSRSAAQTEPIATTPTPNQIPPTTQPDAASTPAAIPPLGPAETPAPETTLEQTALEPDSTKTEAAPAPQVQQPKPDFNTFQLPQQQTQTVKPAEVPQVSNLNQAIDAPETKSQVESFKSKAAGAVTRIKKVNYKPLVSAAVIGILVFGIFNSQVILGQVQYLTTPSGGAHAPNGVLSDTSVGEDPKILIPQINVDVPVVYDEPSFEEDKVQKALERGVVHYGTTAMPGENGNTVIVGHSSNNWWDAGEYKYAFILLDKLNNGDEIVLHYEGVRYIYEVEKKFVVEPSDVSVIYPTDEPTLTLITCTPPGTSWQRLIVQAKQVSPDPSQNAEVDRDLSEPIEALPSDSVSNFFDFFTNLF